MHSLLIILNQKISTTEIDVRVVNRAYVTMQGVRYIKTIV